MTQAKKLIEVAMPIKEISAESVRDKSIRHGHISTLHLWWACRFAAPSQINTNIIEALKEEEWLLESVGLNTLRNNNLLPTPQQAIKAKDIYEAFLRFDYKPMITAAEQQYKSAKEAAKQLGVNFEEEI